MRVAKMAAITLSCLHFPWASCCTPQTASPVSCLATAESIRSQSLPPKGCTRELNPGDEECPQKAARNQHKSVTPCRLGHASSWAVGHACPCLCAAFYLTIQIALRCPPRRLACFFDGRWYPKLLRSEQRIQHLTFQQENLLPTQRTSRG